MSEWIKKLMTFPWRKNDPVFSCEVYKSKGCCHVDGFCCDMETCLILKEHKAMIQAVKEK